MIGHRVALVSAILAALALASCGDSSDPVEPAANAPPTPVAEAAAPAVTPPPATTPIQPEPAPAAVPQAAPAAAELAPPVAASAIPLAVATPTEAPAAPPEPAVVAQAPVPEPPAAPISAPPATPAAPVADAPTRTIAERLAAANAADGAVYLMQCEICHTVAEGGAAGVGPNLFGIVDAPVGRDRTFSYSPAFQALAATDATWTAERLDAFLAAPGTEIPGTRMGFGGFADPDTRANVIAWLATLVPVLGETPDAPQIVGVQIPGLAPVAFVAVQADVGADQYVALGCGNCHGADMRGGTAPPLAGPAFEERWFDESLSDFLAALRTMPPGSPALADARYLELVAAILTVNGFHPGAIPLRANEASLAATGFYQPVAVRRDR